MNEDINSTNIVIEKEDAPGILYKYASWQNIYHKKLISVPQIYLGSILKYDDPFDCGIALRHDLWTIEERKKAWSQLLRDQSPKFQESELNLLIENYKENPSSYNKAIHEGIEESFKEEVGIYCLSEISDNMLMWSLYADKHRGICIGYNITKLEEAVRSCVKNIKDNPWVHFLKTEYKECYPIIRPTTDMKSPRDFINKLKIKFAQWSYQKEWRLTVGINRRITEDERQIKIPMDAIEEIYFGLRMTDKDIDEVTSTLRINKL